MNLLTAGEEKNKTEATNNTLKSEQFELHPFLFLSCLFT